MSFTLWNSCSTHMERRTLVLPQTSDCVGNRHFKHHDRVKVSWKSSCVAIVFFWLKDGVFQPDTPWGCHICRPIDPDFYHPWPDRQSYGSPRHVVSGISFPPFPAEENPESFRGALERERWTISDARFTSSGSSSSRASRSCSEVTMNPEKTMVQFLVPVE